MATIDPRPGGWVQAALAIGVGKTLEEAAELSGCSQRSIRRWLAGSDVFQLKVEEVRRLLISAAVGKLADAAADAIQTLKANLKAEQPSIQVQSASRLLALLLRFRAQDTLQARLDTLQELVDTLKEEHPEWFKHEVHDDGDRDNPG